MKIGIDARLWNQTGVGRYIRSLVKELLVIDGKNSYVLFVLSSEKSEIETQLKKMNRNNWQVVDANVRWHSLSEQINFLRILNAHNLDLMHFTYFSMPILYSKPFVITIHDLIPYHLATGKASTLPYPFYTIKRFAYKVILRKSAKKSQKIIVPLKAIYDDVVKTLHIDSQKVIVTREGFDFSSSDSKSAINTSEIGKYFLYVGNAYPHKNIENLIEGFQLLLKKEKNITLVLVGRKDFFYQRLIGRVKKETLSHVKFIFNATDEDLQKLYREAVALVSASKMEGFGLVPLEAMSQGCIPIVSNIPSFQEVCQDAALYFDPDSEATIAEKMHYVLSMDESMRKEFLSRGKNRILHFSWKDTALATLKVYEDCDRLRPSK